MREIQKRVACRDNALGNLDTCPDPGQGPAVRPVLHTVSLQPCIMQSRPLAAASSISKLEKGERLPFLIDSIHSFILPKNQALITIRRYFIFSLLASTLLFQYTIFVIYPVLCATD